MRQKKKEMRVHQSDREKKKGKFDWERHCDQSINRDKKRRRGKKTVGKKKVQLDNCQFLNMVSEFKTIVEEARFVADGEFGTMAIYKKLNFV